MRCVLACGATALALAGVATLTMAQAPKVGDPPEVTNMRLVGYSDLQARSAYQPTIHKQGNRYIAYVGHHGHTAEVPKPFNTMNREDEFNGTSIIDVTNPAEPKYLKHLPGLAGGTEVGGAQMTRVCSGANLVSGDPNKYYLLRTLGAKAHEVWEVTDPANPVKLSSIGGEYRDTHKNWWECETGIAYLVSAVPGWRVKRMTEIYDLKDPAKPVKIRDFGLAGQEPGSTGAVPTDLHGAISMVDKNRIYFGYGSSSGGILQIIDREKLLKGPKEPTPANLLYPQVSRLDIYPLVGAHTTFPMLQMQIDEFAKDGFPTRDFIMIVNEATQNECKPQAREMVFFADITVETHPMVVSNFNVKERTGNFCERGGRFGAHSSQESMAPVFYKKLAMIAFFNAGLRVIDVRDPYEPKEVAHFIPSITEATDKRCPRVPAGAEQKCKVAIQTNNVETDDRGYIYIVDRANTGLHILELTGPARAIAGLPPLR
jgi:hypothetical protein